MTTELESSPLVRIRSLLPGLARAEQRVAKVVLDNPSSVARRSITEVADALQQKLHRIGRVSFAWNDTHIMLTSAAVLGPGDVAVGISHTGATTDTVEALRVARERGATTVALTNYPTSPITEVADLVL